MRSAFSMLTAIAVIVVMASIGAFVLNMSGKMVQETSAQYQREQAAILARSYSEYAIMAVTANEQNLSTCLDNIKGKVFETEMGGYAYNVEVNISYIGNDIHSNCVKLNKSDINTKKSPLTIVVDTFVRYVDSVYPDPSVAPKTTYHRRTLQKI